MSKIINHVISGNNFHGNYRFTLRGPAEGFILSASQKRKYNSNLCGYSDCTCGGGYGDGPDEDSAKITQINWDDLSLIPSNQ